MNKEKYDPFFFLTTEALCVELRSYNRKIVFRDEARIYDKKGLINLFTTLLLKYGIDIREIGKSIDLTKEIQEMKEYRCRNEKCGCMIKLNEKMITEEKEITCPKCEEVNINPYYYNRDKNGV